MSLKLLLEHLPQVSIDSSGESTRLVRSGLLFGILLFLGLFLWGILAPIRGAVVTSGTIKIDLNRKTLQHLEGGIIKKILVREGSRVEKGQTLLILEDISTRSQFSILKDRLFINQVKEARLQAQKRNLDTIVFPKEITETTDPKFKRILANEIELFNSKRKSFTDQVKLLKFEIIQTENGLIEDLNYTERYYKDFDLTLEFKQEADGNSGVFVRSVIEGTKIAGWQVEVAPKNHDTGGIYESYGRGWLEQIPDEKENILIENEWNKMHIKVVGNEITTWLNGTQMVNLKDEKIGAAVGRIALQIHAGGGIKILWRNIELKEL
ncbi:MAG: DUF1080 domain-containing protein [Methylococcaceae bacterium]|nr:DUF1080 domain-containing protein [Methylococcaceae bacterium]